MKYVWDKNIKWIPGFEGRYAATTDGRIASYCCNSRSHFKPIWLRLRPHPTGYLRVELFNNSKVFPSRVHRLVLMTWVGLCPPGMVACHINGDKTCNHIYNLRWDTHQSNACDSPRGISKYFGVDWSIRYKKWRAKIQVKGKSIYLGHFDIAAQAAKAYDAAARKHFGSNARTNF